MAERAIALKKMTPEQRRQLDEDGYLIIRNALSDHEVEDLTAEVDRLDAESQRQGPDRNSLLDVANILDTAVEELFSLTCIIPGKGCSGSRTTHFSRSSTTRTTSVSSAS